MKLVIGLGNPGKEYYNNRHNVGFLFLDYLRDNLSCSDFVYDKKFDADITQCAAPCGKIILAKPQTFMNHSGTSVSRIMQYFKIDVQDIIVAHDDLDIEIGRYKYVTNVRAAGHNGVADIITQIHSQDFSRIRIGVEAAGGREQRGPIPGKNYVLQDFTVDEQILLRDIYTAAIQDISSACK